MLTESLSLELDSLRSDQVSQINDLVDRFEEERSEDLSLPRLVRWRVERSTRELVLVRLLTQTEMEKGLNVGTPRSFFRGRR